MRELFVYYRVRAEHTEALQAAVKRLHATLRAEQPGLVARLMSRAETEATQTWMETYALDMAGIDAALQARIETLAKALLPLIDGPRHTESFIACAS